MFNKIILIITAVICFTFLIFALNKTIKKYEINECREWQESQYKDFVNWQINQCEYYQIKIK